MYVYCTNQKAELIPWTEIEREYAKLFKGIKGHVAISAPYGISGFAHSDRIRILGSRNGRTDSGKSVFAVLLWITQLQV